MRSKFFISLLLMAGLPAFAGPIVNIEDANAIKNAPVAESVKADPRAKVLQELSQEDDTPKNIGLILDSSGSMGQILEKNKTKMFFLKKLMKGFVGQQWKLKNNIGVRVYGSKFKGRCDDIILPIPYSDHSLGKLEGALLAMAPLGMTPLQNSLQMTVDEIKKKPGPKNIVIVTDGEDTCGGDPCKTAEKVKKESLDVTFYVVALGFKGAASDDELKKIKCMGEDNVSLANDEESFQDAMSQISSKISKRQNLKVISPNPEAPVYLYSIDAAGKRKLERVFYASSEQTVPPGRYDAIVLLNPQYKFDNFEISAGRKTTLKVEGEGEVKVNYFNEFIKVQILDKNNKVVKKFKSDNPAMVPTGKWRIRQYRDPFYEKIISDFYVYPNGNHVLDVEGVGVIKVESSLMQGVYVYDQDHALIDTALTNQPLVLKSGIYAVHVNENCTFERVEVPNKKEVIVLPCKD